MSAIVQVVRRLWLHLSRSKAQAAWIVVLGTLFGDRVAAERLAESQFREIHEFALVLISVVLAYILLPDAAADVQRVVREAFGAWFSREPARLRETYKQEHLLDSLQGILDAVLGRENAQTAKFVITEFVEADRSEYVVQEDFRYAIRVRPAGGHYAVTTQMEVHRRLGAPDGRVWVSFSPEDEVLDTEYGQPGCVHRELVPIDPELWLASRDTFARATLKVNHRPYVGTLDTFRGDLARVVFSGVAMAEIDRLVQVSCEFPLALATRMFPFKTSYFSRGTTEIEFQIFQPVHRLKAIVALLGGPGSGVQDEVKGVTTNIADDMSSSLVRNGPNALLLPGSGVTFVWEPKS